MARKRKIVDLDTGTQTLQSPEEVEVIDLPEVKIEKVEPVEIKTVIGSNKAEALQKEGGWALVSAVKIDVGEDGLTVKEYKSRKEQ